MERAAGHRLPPLMRNGPGPGVGASLLPVHPLMSKSVPWSPVVNLTGSSTSNTYSAAALLNAGVKAT